MIVTCEECSTRFQLDESRIPVSGAQVRCSRCKHAFFLPNPTASQSEAAHSIAEAATHDPASSVPPISSDVADLASTVGGVEPDVESDEEDWQFSEEIRIEGDEDLESESDFGVSQDFGSEFDAEELPDVDVADAFDEPDPGDSSAAISSADPNASTGSGLELGRDDSNFGSVDDFSSLMEDDDEMSADPDSEFGSEPSILEPTIENSGSDKASGSIDDLGDPESWDLVGSHDFAVSKPASEASGRPFQETASGDDILIEDESAESPYEEEIGPASPLRQSLVRVGHAVGWAATIALTVVALGLGLRSEWTRQFQSPQTVSVGALTAETTQASWLETSRSGPVLVVAGRLRNTGSVPLWPGRVQLALLDADGQHLDQLPIPVGERLSPAVLREAAPAQLIASAAVAVSSLGNEPLAPGESRSFEAIVLMDRLPAEARRILLEIGQREIGAGQADPLQVEEESVFSP